MSFTIATQNTMRGAAQLRLLRRGRRVPIATIVVRQERDGIGKGAAARFRRRIRNLMPHRWHKVTRGGLATSGRRARFELVDHYYQSVHGGKAGMTPERGLQVTSSRDRRAGRMLAVVDVWPINGAWKPDKWPETIEERRRLHDDYLLRLRALVTMLHRTHDAVIVAGDFNWPEPVDLPGMRVAARRGLDQIHISDQLQIEHRRWWAAPVFGGDHPVVKARLRWRTR